MNFDQVSINMLVVKDLYFQKQVWLWRRYNQSDKNSLSKSSVFELLTNPFKFELLTVQLSLLQKFRIRWSYYQYLYSKGDNQVTRI